MAFIANISVSAQSIELHQSYGTDSENAPYAATRVIGSYFWSTCEGDMNLFSWNAFDRNAANTVLYTEHQIGKSNWFVHPEIRFDYWYGPLNSNDFDFKPMLGVAYLIPMHGNLCVYLTPKIMTTYDKFYGEWTNPDLQFSVNTSFENDYVYYEGYIDTNWFGHTFGSVKTIGMFTEQKGYFKMAEHFQIGLSLVMSAGKLSCDTKGFFAQPYISFRSPF